MNKIKLEKKDILKYGLSSSMCLLAVAFSTTTIGSISSNKDLNVSKNVKEILSKQDSLPIKDIDPIYTKVDTLPKFQSGLEAFGKFLAKNLRYPPVARDAGIQGRVFLNYIVEKDGSLSDIKVIRGIGGGCDEEAVRVMKLSPKWNPGIQNGKPVRISYTIPIFFQLGVQKEPKSIK